MEKETVYDLISLYLAATAYTTSTWLDKLEA